MTSRADSLTYEDSQGATDIVTRLRGQEPSVLTHWGRTVLEGEAAAEIERLRAGIARWRENSIDAHAASSAMRNSINDYLPMPSIESDLLQGPETSVFCAAVATSVIEEVCRLRTALAEVHLTINALYTERDGARAALAEAREVMEPIVRQMRETKFEWSESTYLGIHAADLDRLAKWLERNQ